MQYIIIILHLKHLLFVINAKNNAMKKMRQNETRNEAE